MSLLVQRIEQVQRQIAQAAGKANRRAEEVTLVAVTKTVQAGLVIEAYNAGLRVFGENRVRQGAAKMAEIASCMPDARWHLIGHLQTNKAKAAIEAFSLIESVDSRHLLETINRRAETLRPLVPVLLEVNVSGEPSKTGFDPETLLADFPQLLQLPYVAIRGLMTVAPLTSQAEDVRQVFRRLRGLRDHLRDRYLVTGFDELSMGMSNDFQVAIEEGATMVRIGRAIFGDRPA